jgi:hypothetical protein
MMSQFLTLVHADPDQEAHQTLTDPETVATLN